MPDVQRCRALKPTGVSTQLSDSTPRRSIAVAPCTDTAPATKSALRCSQRPVWQYRCCRSHAPCGSGWHQARLPPRGKGGTRSSACILLGGKPRHTAPLDVFGELGHVFVCRDSAPLAARQGRLGSIDGPQDFQTPPLALFPKRHGFPHRILVAAEPASLNALADERLLVGSQMYFHMSSRLGSRQGKCQVKRPPSQSQAETKNFLRRIPHQPNHLLPRHPPWYAVSLPPRSIIESRNGT